MPPEKPQPTGSELEILNVLWKKGPCTVRQVFDELSQHRDVGYTTVLKLMQLMNEKGLTSRDESQRSHIYRARIRETPVKKKLVADLLSRAFGGSATSLIMHALSAQRASAEDIAEIRQMLDEMEKDRS